MISPQRNYIYLFVFLAALSAFCCIRLQFGFKLEDFFPDGDDDLDYYWAFIENFETDINFLMVAVERKEGVFEQAFLNQFHDFTLNVRRLPHVKQAASLTTLYYPLKTPFAITSVPAIHRNNPEKYEKDKKRILNDERFSGNLITKNADALVVTVRLQDSVLLNENKVFVTEMLALANSYDFDNYYMLGPPFLQTEMVAMQQREVLMSAVISGILVTIIVFIIYRKWRGVLIALVSIALGLLLFMGLLGLWGRELNAMSALYPVLMIIVGTSDVIHIMSKYIDELKKGKARREAIGVTIREIGLATLLTSLTTAVGFATLLTSRVAPIRDFGLNAAVGVVVAYITVIFFTTSLLVMFGTDKLVKLGRGQQFWDNLMEKTYRFTRDRQRVIGLGAIVVLALAFWGISMITTNYRIESNMPRGAKVTTDFQYFEDQLTGFRPMEIAVYAQGDFAADDYEVLLEMEKLENHLRTIDLLGGVQSLTSLYKSINRMEKGNRASAYEMPDNKKTFGRYKKLVAKVPDNAVAVLLSKDKKQARITARINDAGSDTVQATKASIEQWIDENIDPTIATFHLTGTGLILDKNAEYIRRSLLGGLGIAVIVVSVMMALLFRNIRMVLIALVPNVLPLVLAGALLGFIGIELDAGMSIVFAVIFGIAVDDTIHFLSKYKLSRNSGKSVEDALRITFLETGKAICLTSIILFFGFLVMLFSIHPPSVNIGLLISLTLLSALVGDLLLIPPMLRWMEEGQEALKNPL